MAVRAGVFAAGRAAVIEGQALAVAPRGQKAAHGILAQNAVRHEIRVRGNGQHLVAAKTLPAGGAAELRGPFRHLSLRSGRRSRRSGGHMLNHLHQIAQVKGAVLQPLKGRQRTLRQLGGDALQVGQRVGAVPAARDAVVDVPGAGVVAAEVRALGRVAVPADEAAAGQNHQIHVVRLDDTVTLEPNAVEGVALYGAVGEEAAGVIALHEGAAVVSPHLHAKGVARAGADGHHVAVGNAEFAGETVVDVELVIHCVSLRDYSTPPPLPSSGDEPHGSKEGAESSRETIDTPRPL